MPEYFPRTDGVVVKNGEQNVFYAGEYKVKIVDGVNYHLVIDRAGRSHLSFAPRADLFVFGRGSKKEFEKDPELFWSACVHEIMHRNYFSLNQKEQTEINDFIVKNFPHEVLLFAQRFYGDPVAGEKYLARHKAGVDGSAIFRKRGVGLKDDRILTVEFNGRQEKVWLSALVTELISHASGLLVADRAVFVRELEANNFDDSEGTFYEPAITAMAALRATRFPGVAKLFCGIDEKTKNKFLSIFSK